jgi:murein tripeptide amidase MpaA
VIAARVHPGESNSSYMLHGLIKYLLSTEKIANLLRDKFIFKIIPMLNPDGVIVGNNRTSFLGKDLNRAYLDATSKLTPEIYHLK